MDNHPMEKDNDNPRAASLFQVSTVKKIWHPSKLSCSNATLISRLSSTAHIAALIYNQHPTNYCSELGTSAGEDTLNLVLPWAGFKTTHI